MSKLGDNTNFSYFRRNEFQPSMTRWQFQDIMKSTAQRGEAGTHLISVKFLLDLLYHAWEGDILNPTDKKKVTDMIALVGEKMCYLLANRTTAYRRTLPPSGGTPGRPPGRPGQPPMPPRPGANRTNATPAAAPPESYVPITKDTRTHDGLPLCFCKVLRLDELEPCIHVFNQSTTVFLTNKEVASDLSNVGIKFKGGIYISSDSLRLNSLTSQLPATLNDIFIRTGFESQFIGDSTKEKTDIVLIIRFQSGVNTNRESKSFIKKLWDLSNATNTYTKWSDFSVVVIPDNIGNSITSGSERPLEARYSVNLLNEFNVEALRRLPERLIYENVKLVGYVNHLTDTNSVLKFLNNRGEIKYEGGTVECYLTMEAYDPTLLNDLISDTQDNPDYSLVD